MKPSVPVLNAVILVLVLTGLVVAQSTEIEQLRSAAEQGDASAQFNLGLKYYNGEGVPQDYQEAVKWYRLAAEQGDASAQGSLGAMYYIGEGVPKDDVEAVYWLRLAAGQGHASAQGALGAMYMNGQGRAAGR